MRKNNIRTRTSSKTTVRNVYAKGVLNNKVKSNRNMAAHPSSDRGVKSRLRSHISRESQNEKIKTTVSNTHVKRGLSNRAKVNGRTAVQPSSSDRRMSARLRSHVPRESQNKKVNPTVRNTHVKRGVKVNRRAAVQPSSSDRGMKARLRSHILRGRQNKKIKTTARNVSVKRGLSNKMKLTRRTPVHSSSSTEGIRAALRNHISRQSKEKIKTAAKETARQLARTIDPHDHEEAHDAVTSLELPRDGVKKTRSAYKNIKKSTDRIKHANHYIKNRRYRVPTISAHRKVKGNIATKGGSKSSVNKIKTLSSKYVPKGRYTSLGLKTGMRKAASSAASYLRLAAQQAAKKFVAAIVANPKVWIVGAAIAAVIFFLMMLTNNLGGTTTSSAGSFFMTDEENARQYKNVVERLDNEFQDEISRLQNSSGYDDIRTDYMNEDGFAHASWVEMFAILAVQFEQDLEFTDEQKKFMEEIHGKFNVIETRTQTYTERKCSRDSEGNRDCDTITKKRLIIEIYTYDMEDIFEQIGFNEEQQEWARRLVTSGAIQEQFPDLAQELPGGGTGPGPGIPPPEFTGDVSEARKKLIEAALTLEGRVKYFWGGKSGPGWNDKWGTPVKVTAPGSKTTGTYQPYGMDCSGFIDWAFKTAGLGNSFSAGGTSYQWGQTYAIKESELIPGDLVFKNVPGQGGVNHIGIFIGRDSKGKAIYVHCQGGTGVIVNSYKGFKYPRRPLLFSGE
ncbi:NlpC/P60 family protein [Paenibacillus peoriae]|uniref:C40 family peptidase n=2 Tax=Paenibacillus TaxID=44249 RepID=UPI00026C688F|nr:NlpC/P60 family protein [Paenibacillus peoriae]MEC0182332.1 NlpC/P60 family protein [Paenibacillus peoriae]